MIFNFSVSYNNIKSFFHSTMIPGLKLIDFFVDALIVKSDYNILMHKFGDYVLKYRINQYTKDENILLKKMLDLKNNSDYTLIACEIIGAELSQNNYLIVNKGKNMGISEGMPVIFLNGIVGKVMECGTNSAVIETYSNINFKIGIMNEQGTFFGIAEYYNGKLLEINNIMNTIPIKKGDTLVTSGLGQLFPPNIPIGYVKDIENVEDIYKKAYIIPFENIKKLKFVFIIKKENTFIFKTMKKNTKTIGRIGWFLIEEKTK